VFSLYQTYRSDRFMYYKVAKQQNSCTNRSLFALKSRLWSPSIKTRRRRKRRKVYKKGTELERKNSYEISEHDFWMRCLQLSRWNQVFNLTEKQMVRQSKVAPVL